MAKPDEVHDGAHGDEEGEKADDVVDIGFERAFQHECLVVSFQTTVVKEKKKRGLKSALSFLLRA